MDESLTLKDVGFQLVELRSAATLGWAKDLASWRVRIYSDVQNRLIGLGDSPDLGVAFSNAIVQAQEFRRHEG